MLALFYRQGDQWSFAGYASNAEDADAFAAAREEQGAEVRVVDLEG